MNIYYNISMVDIRHLTNQRMGPNLAQRKAVRFYFNLSFRNQGMLKHKGQCNLSFRNQWGCGSRRGNITCLSIIRGGGQQEGNCNLSCRNQVGGGSRRKSETCPSVMYVLNICDKQGGTPWHVTLLVQISQSGCL